MKCFDYFFIWWNHHCLWGIKLLNRFHGPPHYAPMNTHKSSWQWFQRRFELLLLIQRLTCACFYFSFVPSSSILTLWITLSFIYLNTLNCFISFKSLWFHSMLNKSLWNHGLPFPFKLKPDAQLMLYSYLRRGVKGIAVSVRQGPCVTLWPPGAVHQW